MLKRFLAATALVSSLMLSAGVERLNAECYMWCDYIWKGEDLIIICYYWCD